MEDLIVEKVDIDSLTPYHRNPRRGNVAKIAESLKTRGQYRPIVVNSGEKTGINEEILAGNHTWQAAQIVLADNRLADIGDYDMQALADVIKSVQSPQIGTGYSDEDIAEILAATAPKEVPT